jgi:hypothetical protein
MNEPSSFETNEDKPWNWMYPEGDERHPWFTLKCPINRLDDPPYRTSNFFFQNKTFQIWKFIFKKIHSCLMTIALLQKKLVYHKRPCV